MTLGVASSHVASVSHFNPLRRSFHKKKIIPRGGWLQRTNGGICDSCSYFSDCGNKSLVFQKSVEKEQFLLMRL